MKILKTLSLKEQLVYIMISVLSLTIFVYYLSLNNKVSYHDEVGYFNFAKDIQNLGLFEVANGLRTYLYSLIISIFLVVSSSENVFISKILMSIFQYGVYLCTIFFLAVKSIESFKVKDQKKAFLYITGFGLLNPYLIQSTTLFLTDILATCFSVLAITIVQFCDCTKFRYKFITFILIYSAIMIRPSSLIFLLIMLMLLTYKIMKYSEGKTKQVFVGYAVAAMISTFVFLPQLYMNVTKFNNFTPLIHENLYDSQSKWAVEMLKYGTVVIPDEQPQLYWTNPIQTEKDIGIYELIYKDFFAFIFVYIAHIFGVLDWGYIDTYINNFYPISRLVGSVFLYVTWILIFSGIFKVIRKKEINFRFMGLLISAICYTLFIATTAIESRFGYPMFFLLLPFIGWFSTESRLSKRSLFGIISLVIVMFLISFVLDLQTGRINWFEFLFKTEI
ncbi:hypothetical protein R6U77_01920 [Lysinibacillus louembei]|uniref:Glycosyltransferase RgtA/B/C/D-like domain-containing protein n=1 Tax=Lysinibacillus louembei TaxID=1470088 RepID=A0ABZ0RYW2_9BACI|nr:hypothetical protein [Lysinibacillus louembei]WPK12476.1 hypothetical protein R6U77_01920 [Lysinibacillus louembei]